MAKDNPETNPITIKPKTANHVAELFSWVPLPYCPPSGYPFPIKSLAWTARRPSCCRKGDLFQGPKLGSCLTLGNELSEETHVLAKQEILLGKGAWADGRRVREPRRIALSHGFQSRVLW